MAIYLGSVKVAGLGSGNANIVSCDSYEDYMSRTHDLKTMYVTPDQDALVNSNIVSCDSYEDYMSRKHDPKTMYVTPDKGTGGQRFALLSDFALLSVDLYSKLNSILLAINDSSEASVETAE